MNARHMHLQSAIGETTFAADRALEASAALSRTIGTGSPAPLSWVLWQFQAKQDALTSISELAENAILLLLCHLPHENTIALTIFLKELGTSLSQLPFQTLDPIAINRHSLLPSFMRHRRKEYG